MLTELVRAILSIMHRFRCLAGGVVTIVVSAFSIGCNSLPKAGDIPVTMPQVREGTVTRQQPPAAPPVTPRSAPAENTGEMEVAVVGGLNYRQAPGTGARILGVIPYQARITVLERNTDARKGTSGRWFKIRYGNATGYVNSKYLRELGEIKSLTVSRQPGKRKNR